MNDYFLNEQNRQEAREIFMSAIDAGIDFKLQKEVRKGNTANINPNTLIEDTPESGKPLIEVQREFNERFLPFCSNFSSSNFMGFPDAGNSMAAITGSLTADFLQQNLINQSFCSPSGTFAEISVIRWLRDVVGYTNPEEVNDIFDIGGIVTGGGTTSNTISILMAREHHKPGAMAAGVGIDDDCYLIVPKGIGHYSVKGAQMWIGCGNRLLEVETDNFRYNLEELEAILKQYRGRIMGLVAYAGDSRTMTVEHFDRVAELVRSIDPSIWLHADACHGFSLGFSDSLKTKLRGIEQFDSITTDPHKVMNSPYTVSALLVRDPQKIRTISTTSDLIMQEQFALGQITPFIGSKPWMSLKLWFAMKNIGRKGFGEIIDKRHHLALDLATLIDESSDFIRINEVDINAVAFLYTGNAQHMSVEGLNEINKDIHATMIQDGLYHLHQFSIPDAGIFEKGAVIYPLRFMSGNPNTTKQDLVTMLDYIRDVAQSTEGNI